MSAAEESPSADFGPPRPALEKKAEAVPYDPSRTRENFRGLIALILIGLMAAIIAASFTLLWLHPDRGSAFEHFFSLIFGPVVALVGAATGYYFGAESNKRP